MTKEELVQSLGRIYVTKEGRLVVVKVVTSSENIIGYKEVSEDSLTQFMRRKDFFDMFVEEKISCVLVEPADGGAHVIDQISSEVILDVDTWAKHTGQRKEES